MRTSGRLNSDVFTRRSFGVNLCRAGLLAALFLACTKQELPDLGPRLSQTAAVELSPSLLASKAEYTDNCGHMQIVDLGPTLQDKIFEAVNRTFASVVRPGSGVKPDLVLRVNLVQSNFNLRMDGIYDRADTDLRLGGLVSVVDQKGSASPEQEVQVAQRGRVRIQPIQKNCDYILDGFIEDAANEFAHKVSEVARRQLARSGTPPPVTGPATAGSTAAAAGMVAAAPAAIPVPVPGGSSPAAGSVSGA